MNLVLLFDRVLGKIKREYRQYIFRKKTGCKHKDFLLIGDVLLVNTNITVGHNVTIYPGVSFFGDGTIVLGDNVAIGNDTILYASKAGGLTIGNDTMIAAQCYLIDTDHGTQKGMLMRQQPCAAAPITIGKDVWIASNVTVLKGSVIEDGAVVGAKALVKGYVPAETIVAGVPAKMIKTR